MSGYPTNRPLTARGAPPCPFLRAGSDLLKLRVLRFCSDEDGNVRVGVFPERKEILVVYACPSRVPDRLTNARKIPHVQHL
jgi:hypothetical protein